MTPRRRPPARSHRPKGDKRDRTRAALIAAAADVIGRKGLDRTSLEHIAEHAGVTRGAIYGNFRDKEELFLAVAMSRWGPVLPPPNTPGVSLRERMRVYGERVADAAEARRTEAAGATSFVQYALTHPRMRAMLEGANAQIYAAAAAELSKSFDRDSLPVPPEQFVRTVHALTEGLVVLHALTPNLISRDVIVEAFEALAGS